MRRAWTCGVFLVFGSLGLMAPASATAESTPHPAGSIASTDLSGPAATAAEEPARTGTISGLVVDAETGSGIGGAQISIPDEDMGTTADGEGNFTLEGVPAGTHEIEVDFLGYDASTETVTVESGEEVNVEISLSTAAIDLDEVMVTGSPAGEQRRRASGTGIAGFDVEDQLRDAPVMRVQDVMRGREAGVLAQTASGTTGTAGPMVLRGINSLTQDNQPLIYVDGVRLDRGAENMAGTGGQAVSRLNDLNPRDIERVEMVKGSAATAMYGSEASSGVVQIFTRSGQPGETTYQAGIQMGANRIPDNLHGMHPDPQYPHPNDLLRTGLHQEYSASIRGATDEMGYFASLTHTDNEGSFPNNRLERTSARLNLDTRPTDNLSAEVSTNFSMTENQLPPNDNWIQGVLTTLYLGNPHRYGDEEDPWGGAFIPVPMALEREIIDDTKRFTGAVTLDYDMLANLSHRLTVGLEFVDQQGRTFLPYWDDTERGTRGVNTRRNIQTNIDYGASFQQDWSANLESDISGGGQFFVRRDHRVNAGGDEFASPGLQALGGTGLPSVGESELNYTTGGLFAQHQLGYRDRLFWTVGLRMDGSSAFGDDFGWETFPKTDLSYVISDEDWFDVSWISNLRLRSGIGMAGTQPGAFDHVRTFTNVQGLDGQTGIRAATHGNPDLAPEVSREIEGGFEAALFADRVTLDLTAYHQNTEDLLHNQQFSPSLGLPATQLTNVGEVRNMGIEFSGDVTAYSGPSLDWAFNVGYNYNHNEVMDLGDTPYEEIDRFGTRVKPGYPATGKWENVIVGYDDDDMPIASDTAVYLGESIPPHNGHLATDVAFGNFNIRANGQFGLGHVVNNHIVPYMIQSRTGEKYYSLVEEHGGDEDHPEVVQLRERANIYGEFIEDADYFRLQELSVGYSLPDELVARMGAADVRVNAAAQNLFVITPYSGSDPEMSSTFGTDGQLSVGADYFSVPPARKLRVGVDVTF